MTSRDAPPGSVDPGSADPGSRRGTPASANPPAPPPVPPDAPADPAAAGTGPGHGLVPPRPTERAHAPSPSGAVRHHTEDDAAAPLLGLDARDRLTARLHHAVSGFVDGPRRAVEEADDIFEEAARTLEQALARRREALRESWRNGDGDPAGGTAGDGPDAALSGTETEELRLALRQYRQATERLLKL